MRNIVFSKLTANQRELVAVIFNDIAKLEKSEGRDLIEGNLVDLFGLACPVYPHEIDYACTKQELAQLVKKGGQS